MMLTGRLGAAGGLLQGRVPIASILKLSYQSVLTLCSTFVAFGNVCICAHCSKQDKYMLFFSVLLEPCTKSNMIHNVCMFDIYVELEGLVVQWLKRVTRHPAAIILS